ncbi:hypothetical protein A2U01_0098611, partial [Trifolium medium]|nr:hypothetical protein [Trifolium medium]
MRERFHDRLLDHRYYQPVFALGFPTGVRMGSYARGGERRT